MIHISPHFEMLVEAAVCLDDALIAETNISGEFSHDQRLGDSVSSQIGNLSRKCYYRHMVRILASRSYICFIPQLSFRYTSRCGRDRKSEAVEKNSVRATTVLEGYLVAWTDSVSSLLHSFTFPWPEGSVITMTRHEGGRK